MKILAHRGYWTHAVEKNSFVALRTALEKGYGFESDIRDYLGKLVISHDIPDSNCPDAEKIFELLREFNDSFVFAINIKADGLKNLLKDLIEDYDILNYFLFDMSIPQMIEFYEVGLRFFTRQSEIEPLPVMLKEAIGVWIDGFWSTDWITENLLNKYVNDGKEICLVSPELHGKINYREFWRQIKNFRIDFNKIMLCTDRPDEARCFFSE